MFGDQPVDANDMQPMVDETGLPLNAPQQPQPNDQQQPMVRPDGTGEPTQQELDQAFPPQQRAPNPRQQPYPPQRQPQPSATPTDAPQPRPDAA